MMAHAHDEPQSLQVAKTEHEKIVPACSKEGISDALNSVIMKCLAKKQEDRYASVRDFADALLELPENGQWNERLAQRWWESNCRNYQAQHG
jgi:hypothetical protein